MEHPLDPARLGDHLDRLYRAAWALCGRREEAEDLVQETYARVLARPRFLRNDDDLGARAARATFAISTSGRGRPTWNLVVSNVPGPQFPLYCAGARLVANYPVSVITDGMGLNITVMSYCGKMDFGIVADRDQMPDLWSMLDRLRESLEELK